MSIWAYEGRGVIVWLSYRLGTIRNRVPNVKPPICFFQGHLQELSLTRKKIPTHNAAEERVVLTTASSQIRSVESIDAVLMPLGLVAEWPP
jgi:hypothetical protein